MNTNLLILIMFIITMVPIYFLIGYQVFKKKDKKENNQEMVKKLELLLTQENIITKIDDMVDELIKKAANVYIILNFGFDEEKYIISAESEEMSLYIKAMIKKNMTPEMLSLIGLVRNVNTEKELDQYLDLKIKLYVIAIVIDKNKLLD